MKIDHANSNKADTEGQLTQCILMCRKQFFKKGNKYRKNNIEEEKELAGCGGGKTVYMIKYTLDIYKYFIMIFIIL